MSEQTKKKYSSVSDFIECAEAYRAKLDSRGRPIAGTIKLGETSIDYAIDKVTLRLKAALKESKIQSRLLDKCEDIRAENCMTVEKEGKTVLLKGENGKHLFSLEKEKIVTALIRAEIESFNEILISFEPYFAKHIPNDLTMEQVEAFRGFVIPEDHEVKEPEFEQTKKIEAI